MKKKIQKNLKLYPRDHVSVMLENMQSEFKVFGDGQKSLADRFDKFDVRLSSVEDKTSRDGLRLMVIDGKLDGLKRDIKDSYKSTAEYLSRIENEIQLMKPEIKDLKTRLKQKADLERLLNLEKRLIKMEKLVLAKLG